MGQREGFEGDPAADKDCCGPFQADLPWQGHRKGCGTVLLLHRDWRLNHHLCKWGQGGEPEPMKSEIMASRDCYEMKRLDYGKVLLQTNSKFLPAELTMKADEHWQAELPDLGKVLGIMTEMKRSLMIVF